MAPGRWRTWENGKRKERLEKLDSLNAEQCDVSGLQLSLGSRLPNPVSLTVHEVSMT
jgi:hypothetical protein